MSLRASVSSPRQVSGLMYPGVPSALPLVPSWESLSQAVRVRVAKPDAHRDFEDALRFFLEYQQAELDAHRYAFKRVGLPAGDEVSITFDLDLGDNAVVGGRPDQFAFFVLDNTQLPFATDDPSGAGALFAFDLVGGAATRPVAFNSNFARATVELRVINPGVPEPGTLLLVPLALAFALGVAGSARRRRRGRLGVAALC